MTKRHALPCLIAARPAFLIACGAARLPPVGAGKLIRGYGGLTGADSSYGFFAPGIGEQLRASFVLVDGAGRTWEDVLDPGGNREVELRVGSILGMSSMPEIGEAVRASWAARML